MANKQEWVPWYRRKTYDGNLTEEEKRHLDSFRLREKHPATSYHDLPDEVQRYISRIELELYDKKQEAAANKVFLAAGVAAVILYLGYDGLTWSSLAAFSLGTAILVFGWFQYSKEWNRNAEEFQPSGDMAPIHQDQGIQEEWEHEYIFRRRRTEEDASLMRTYGSES